MMRKKLIEKLAETAWLVLNHDNDWTDGQPHNVENWRLLNERLDQALPRSIPRDDESEKILMARDFNEDFVKIAVREMSPEQRRRVSLALDCAVQFGALEALGGNISLNNEKLPEWYADNVDRLRKGF